MDGGRMSDVKLGPPTAAIEMPASQYYRNRTHCSMLAGGGEWGGV